MKRILLILTILTFVAGSVIGDKEYRFRQLDAFDGHDEKLDTVLLNKVQALRLDENLDKSELEMTFAKINEMLEKSKSYETKLLMKKVKKINDSKISRFNCFSSPEEKALIKEATSLLLELPKAAKSYDSSSDEIMAVLYWVLDVDVPGGPSQRIFVDYARQWGQLCIQK